MTLTQLDQVCIVVRDLNKSMESMWNTFGIGPWGIYIYDADFLSDMTYRGNPARFGMKVARTSNNPGGFEIELIQPIGEDNIYSDFLREHGEGIQHLGWYKVDSPEAFAETAQKLEKAGFPCIMSGRTYKTTFAYFDTSKALHTILEMTWADPSISLRPPVSTFPE